MQYEVEVKALLGSQERADELLTALQVADVTFSKKSEQTQRNHYFEKGDLHALANVFANVFSKEQLDTIKEIAAKATKFSVRSRQRNNDVLLVIKGSLDDRSAIHSVRRMEFEESVPTTLEELDEKIISAGFELEAKWSAQRTVYAFKDMTVDMIFSPGYGYMAELEKVVEDETSVEDARKNILATLEEFGLEELNPERHDRMYAHYNAHWPEYYGTTNVFTIV